MEYPNISVVLPTFRQPEVLIQTIRDLRYQTYPEDLWELIILDDGSRDGSDVIGAESFRNDVPFVLKRLPPNDQTYSHASLFNELVRLARPETELIVHAEDVRLQEDFLYHHAKWSQVDETTLVTGPICEGPLETFEREDCERWELMGMSGEDTEAYECGFRSVWAKTMSYSVDLVERLSELEGGEPFDSDMSDWGFHEVEFAYRASELADAKCVYDVNCSVYHPPHNQRDERIHREVDRSATMEDGESKNTEYVCEKHGLDELPSWKSGEPITPPTIDVVTDQNA